MIILIPLLVCIVGALSFALAGNAKVSQLGLWAYVTGLLVTLYWVSDHAVTLLK